MVAFCPFPGEPKQGYQREVYEKRLMDALNEKDEVG
jgi:hypothetical protein